MADAIVLVHGLASGGAAWAPVAGLLRESGHTVYAPDRLGYGTSPVHPTDYRFGHDVSHLSTFLTENQVDRCHLVAHSGSAVIALCLQQVLGERITQVTLIDPVIVSVLRESAEDAALLVMENQYETFMALREKPDAAAKFFVDLWSGRGVWEQMGQQSRILVASLVPTIAREMTAARLDRSTLAWLTELAGPTTIVVGENTLLPARVTTRLLAGARKIKPIEIGGAGHMIPLTHPHDATAAILESAAAC